MEASSVAVPDVTIERLEMDKKSFMIKMHRRFDKIKEFRIY